MAVGKRRADEQAMWAVTTDLPRPPGRPFYEKLNALLRESGFDRFCEGLCAPYYAETMGRPSIPPGVYFRMLLVGYFEGTDSQRDIAWRCSDRLAVREFLRLKATQPAPDHSSLTVIRRRLPLAVHEQVFTKVLSIAQEKGVLEGSTVAVDSTTLEANAAMKSIVRKDTGEDWKEYVGRLAQEAGLEDPTDEALRRFDRKRKGKKCSNDDWQSPSDPDARITKMKNGDTHLAYKAEHAVDLETTMVVAAQICHAAEGNAETLVETVTAAQGNLTEAGSAQRVEEAVADKGYHQAAARAECAEAEIRTYIPERQGKRRTWTDKPEGQQAAAAATKRTGGAEFRPCVRDGPRAAKLDTWDTRGDQALPDPGRRAQPRHPHAETLRGRHAEEPAGLLGCLPVARRPVSIPSS